MEILKEEFSKIKFYIKVQVIQSDNIIISSWFMYLYPDIDIKILQKFFYISSKYIKDNQSLHKLKELFLKLSLKYYLIKTKIKNIY